MSLDETIVYVCLDGETMYEMGDDLGDQNHDLEVSDAVRLRDTLRNIRGAAGLRRFYGLSTGARS